MCHYASQATQYVIETKWWQHSEECMCHLRNIALESVTEKCDRQTETDRRTTDKVISMCHYASQATQKLQSYWQIIDRQIGRYANRQTVFLHVSNHQKVVIIWGAFNNVAASLAAM